MSIRIMRAGAAAKAPTGLFCYRVDAERFLVGGGGVFDPLDLVQPGMLGADAGIVEAGGD